jgi:hypothetical protein
MEVVFGLTVQMTSVASELELTLLLRKLASLKRILALKMFIHPVSKNAWICTH